MKRWFASFLAAVFSASVCIAQNANTPKRLEAVVVPQEAYLQTIVQPAECPLRFERAELLRYLQGGFGASYRLRNVGNKSIKSYEIAIWDSDNTGTTISWHANQTPELIMPRQSIPARRNDSDLSIVPLTARLKSYLELSPPIKKIVFFLVVRVGFSDGSTYKADETLEGLKYHLKSFEIIYEKKDRKAATAKN